MKSRTISKIIRAKMDEWSDGINDTYLKDNFYDNIIVTGGCIPSMYLNTDVHDYDVYIKNYDYMIKLMQYYINESIMNNSLDNESIMIIYNTSESETRPKIYTSDKVKKEMPFSKYNDNPVMFSSNAISLANDVQIIYRFYGNPEEIHKNYDFVHCTSYWTYSEGLVTTKEALEAILTKSLRYQGSRYPVASLFRIRKFLDRGYTITAAEMLKMILQCQSLDLSNSVVLKDQVEGVDIAYFTEVLAYLNKTYNSPSSISYDMLMEALEKCNSDIIKDEE